MASHSSPIGATLLLWAALGCSNPSSTTTAAATDASTETLGSQTTTTATPTSSSSGSSSSPDLSSSSGSAGPDLDEAFLFDETLVRTYELEVAPDDWAWLGANALLEEYVPATLHFEGQVYAQAALRYKGAVGSLKLCFDGMGNQICDKLSLKLAFDQVDPEGRFYGLKKLNFHGMESDPTRMHEAIGYRLFREVGVAAPRNAYARVLVNGELLGLYALIEQVDGRFTRERFPDGGEGNLYKDVWPVHASEQPYLNALETNKDEAPSAAKILRFADALTQAGDAGFAALIDAWIGIDYLARYMATARLLDSWDDIVAWYCIQGQPCINHNYFWYESTTEDRLWLIAWDLDHSLEEPSPIRTKFGMPDWDDLSADCTPIDIFLGIQGRAPACDPFIRRIATQLWGAYASESQALLDGAFSVAAINARIDELSAIIADAVAEDPKGPSFSEWQNSVTALRAAVLAKREHVAAKL